MIPYSSPFCNPENEEICSTLVIEKQVSVTKKGNPPVSILQIYGSVLGETALYRFAKSLKYRLSSVLPEKFAPVKMTSCST